MDTPQHIVAVPASQTALYIGRRTRRWAAGKVTNLKGWPFQRVEPATQQWPRITATGPGIDREHVRVEHEDGLWGNHRLDRYLFVEATPAEHGRAKVMPLEGGYGTHPLLDVGEPLAVPTEVGDQFVMF